MKSHAKAAACPPAGKIRAKIDECQLKTVSVQKHALIAADTLYSATDFLSTRISFHQFPAE
jgi:hypothetical protein